MDSLHNYPSLSEVHQSVDTTSTRRPGWRKILSFFGPAYLVSVGYMDPGNWATDIAGGSHFGYSLLWVLLMSNGMALVLQSLSARLGIVRGRDLAQANREAYPKLVNFCLYVLAEIAITACDLAEVLGMAIGIQLLTGLPLIYGVAITALDTILLLFLQKLGMRRMEIFILSLIAVVGISFFTEIFLAKPALAEIGRGLIPGLPGPAALYVAIGITRFEDQIPAFGIAVLAHSGDQRVEAAGIDSRLAGPEVEESDTPDFARRLGQRSCRPGSEDDECQQRVTPVHVLFQSSRIRSPCNWGRTARQPRAASVLA